MDIQSSCHVLFRMLMYTFSIVYQWDQWLSGSPSPRESRGVSPCFTVWPKDLAHFQRPAGAQSADQHREHLAGRQEAGGFAKLVGMLNY